MNNNTQPRTRTLAYWLMMRFALCMAVLVVLALPLLYFITTHYYAEDLTRLVAKYGVTNTHIDLEEDTLMGMFIQFFAIIVLLFTAVFLVMRYVPQRLWRPFYATMRRIETFRVEKGNVPNLPPTGVSEFDELNGMLSELMAKSVKSYRLQKEFTENAWHELQTPLAIAQMKIDALQQDPCLTDRQAEGLQDVYIQLRRMSRLSRSLLLLSKIENSQFRKDDRVSIRAMVEKLLTQWLTVSGDRVVDFKAYADVVVACNETLMESLLTNLVVNAIRHGSAGSTVHVELRAERLTVSNRSATGPLDKEHIFNRFYHTGDSHKGYGLGLAIVKSICDFHHWRVDYQYESGRHTFIIEGWGQAGGSHNNH